MNRPIHILGGGLAGSEAALQLARCGMPVILFERMQNWAQRLGVGVRRMPQRPRRLHQEPPHPRVPGFRDVAPPPVIGRAVFARDQPEITLDLVAYFFTLVISKGFEGKGWMEGVRYGTYMAMIVALPSAYGMYGAMPIPYSLALKWFLGGWVEMIICGVALTFVFAKKEASAA